MVAASSSMNAFECVENRFHVDETLVHSAYDYAEEDTQSPLAIIAALVALREGSPWSYAQQYLVAPNQHAANIPERETERQVGERAWS